jgi:hypothetical protein
MSKCCAGFGRENSELLVGKDFERSGRVLTAVTILAFAKWEVM